MFDAKNERHEFVADTREAAVEKAAKFFGVEADALTIGGFGDGDVYGLGVRAVVVACLKDRVPPTPGRGDSRGGDRGGRGRDRDRGRGRDGGRDRDGGRGRGRGRGERSERGDRGERSERGSAPAAVAAPVERAAPAGPSTGVAQGEIGEIGRFVLGTVERLGLGPFEIAESSEGEVVAFEVTGAAAERLSAGDGRAVDALQLLANQVAKQDDEEPKRVVIDIEGNADAREELLEGLASRAADRARKTGRAVALDPMNGRDRRTIHLALRDEADVATMSVGEGRYRQVVIAPEGAAEFERAVRESKAAANAQEG